ncbi:hypothetical protein [uncultured Victivallis sp.]|uniref:hypothetical protein n=1 Tax=uncultured Victivallis sp. TaxID=354118 RepID=UPI0025E09E4C|nr:hypothetical protein [uncultured Victivallis sp.]
MGWKRWCGLQNRAAGAVFALTLPGGGIYIALSLALVLWRSGRIAFIQAAFLVCCACCLVTFWYVIATTWFYHIAYRRVFRCHPLRRLPLVAGLLLPFVWLILWYFERYWDWFWVTWLLYGWLLPLVIALRSLRTALLEWLTVVSGAIGIFLLALVGGHLFSTFLLQFAFLEELSGGPPYYEFALPVRVALPLLSELPLRYGISGEGWGWLAFSALFFLAAAYCFRIGWIARMSGCRVRRLLCWPVWVLWSCVALVYAGSLFLAHQAEREVAQRHLRLERHFGRPVTAAALREMWNPARVCPESLLHEAKKQWRVLLQRRFSSYEHCGWIESSWSVIRFGLIPAQDWNAFKENYLRDSEAWAELDRWIDEHALLEAERTFETGKLRRGYFQVGFYSDVSYLLEMELFRVRLALEQGELPEALERLERLRRNADRFLDSAGARIGIQEAFFANGLLELEMYCLELILESGLADEALLRHWERILVETEARLPESERRMLYCDTVVFVDEFEAIARFGSPYAGNPEIPFQLVPLQSVRYSCPLIWWLFRREQAAYMESCESPDSAPPVAVIVRERIWRPGYSCIRMRIPEMYRMMSARLRTARALLALELEFRRNGRYPETPDFLPEDPFSGKPLLFRIGPYETRGEPVGSGIQVWSVGPNGRDDGGARDDIRAVRLLAAPPGGPFRKE